MAYTRLLTSPLALLSLREDGDLLDELLKGQDAFGGDLELGRPEFYRLFDVQGAEVGQAGAGFVSAGVELGPKGLRRA